MLTASESGSKVTLTDSNGDLAVEFDRGIAVVSGTAPIKATTSNGTTTITHAKPFTANQVSGPTANSSTSITIPQATFDLFGHYVSTTNRTATLNHVLGTNVDTSAATHYLVGSATSGSNTAALVKSSRIFFTPSTGAFEATSLFENGKQLNTIYAPIAHVDVVANGTVLGHVKLSDSTNSTSNVGGGVAATPGAVKAVMDYAKSIIASGDAMIFKGSIGASGVIAGLADVNGKTLATLADYKAGWTFRVNVAQTITGVGALEVGDLIMAIDNKGEAYSASHFTVAQTNVDGAVTAINALTVNQLVVGDSSSKGVKSLGAGSNGTYLKISGGIPKWEALNVYALDVRNGGTSVGSYNPLSNTNNTISFSGGLKASFGSGIFSIAHSNSITAQTGKAVRSFSYDANGHITGSDVVTSLPTAEKITFSDGQSSPISKGFDGSSALNVKFTPASGDVKIKAALSGNDLTYTIGHTHRYRPFSYAKKYNEASVAVYNDTTATALKIVPGNANISMNHTGGALEISAVNTWRNVTAYGLSGNSSEVLTTSMGTLDLQFGSEFI